MHRPRSKSGDRDRIVACWVLGAGCFVLQWLLISISFLPSPLPILAGRNCGTLKLDSRKRDAMWCGAMHRGADSSAKKTQPQHIDVRRMREKEEECVCLCMCMCICMYCWKLSERIGKVMI